MAALLMSKQNYKSKMYSDDNDEWDTLNDLSRGSSIGMRSVTDDEETSKE